MDDKRLLDLPWGNSWPLHVFFRFGRIHSRLLQHGSE